MTGTAPSALAATVEPAALVDLARGLIATGRRHVLGIAGTPGAGKSTVSAALVAALGAQAVLVGMDGFHLSNRALERLGRADRKGAPDTFDVAGYLAFLVRARANTEDVWAPVFDRGLEESIAASVVVPTHVPLVVTEGNYLLLESDGWAPVRSLLDTAWFVDVEQDERMRRLEARRRSYGHPADAAAAWVREVDEPNAFLAESSRGRADLVVRLPSHPYDAEGIAPASSTEGAEA